MNPEKVSFIKKKKRSYRRRTKPRNPLASLPLTQQTELILKSLNLDFAEQYQFCENRKWRFDYVIGKSKEQIESIKVAIEVHGGIYKDGGHIRPILFQNDRQKINTAVVMGWKVLEFTQLFYDHCLVDQYIKKALIQS